MACLRMMNVLHVAGRMSHLATRRSFSPGWVLDKHSTMDSILSKIQSMHTAGSTWQCCRGMRSKPPEYMRSTVVRTYQHCPIFVSVTDDECTHALLCFQERGGGAL